VLFGLITCDNKPDNLWKEVKVVYCPTGNMAADMLAKPLQDLSSKNSGMRS